MIVAMKARLTVRRASLICANPWIAVAVRLLGFSDFVVTGIYAVPGSRSWQILRKAIGNRPVVCLVDSEAQAWCSDGGRATSVLYGNTFGYPPAEVQADGPRIFIGGTSDRDLAVVDRLISEIRRDVTRVQLVIADGTGPARWDGVVASIEWLGRVSQPEFGRRMSQADVVFIPLVDSSRSAGHMVLVGALECGLPVVTTPVQGVGGYIDGNFVRVVDPVADHLSTLIDTATAMSAERDRIREYWMLKFSLNGYVVRLRSAFDVFGYDL
ncbi:glycosyltransferase [Williamsia sp. D3]|uniref:glycosyltransferase n=1 Tax=Williamsia sp. D3 TaxID=1313067 RepID=UPI0012695AB6|nr:glycosyltransferase [Williamsia sp. D3]